VKPSLQRLGAAYGNLAGAVAILAGAVALRVLTGVGFLNYDTLYALVWGQQLARGETPQYGLPVAPTPHPLAEALGAALAPLGPHAAEQVVLALAFLALAACGWVLYRLGSLWFNRAAGALAALLLLTRVPVLSYGVRAYLDVPYLLAVLCALLVECRRSRAGAPVLALLALAGLLRPEAWVFAGGYWVYLAWPRLLPVLPPLGREHERTPPPPQRTTRELVWLALLAAAAPLLWVASDWAVTGNPLWSLTNTRHTAAELHRARGIGAVPEYVPRRIGEVLGPAGLAAAAAGVVLAVLWLRVRGPAAPGPGAAEGRHPTGDEGHATADRRRPTAVGLAAGVVAVAVFAALSAAGLPIDERYAFPAATIGCVFAGGALCGWASLPRGTPMRRRWGLAAAAVGIALLATAPAQYRTAHRQLDALARQQRAAGDLVALVRAGALTTRCGPVGVPNHAPIPLLALWLRTPPADVVSAQVRALARGTYVDAATPEVRRDYVLDPADPNRPVTVPPGFAPVGANRSWRVYRRCRE